MKDYFAFNLKPQRLLPVWILFLVLFMVPYIYVIMNINDFVDPHHLSTLFSFYGIMILLMIISYSLIFYMLKLTIEGIEFKGESFVFEGTFGQFIGKFLLGLFLTIITLGIYSPWFITKIQKFIVDHTSHDSNNLQFAGTAGKLFKILFFTTFLPLIVLIIVMVYVQLKSGHSNPGTVGLFTNLVIAFILIPYMYYFYKWMVNVTFKDFSIRWETSFWHSCGKILLELFLTVITVGIYYPIAALHLYKYFIERTYASSESSRKGFGYELEARKDFLFIWGQVLLSIITLGIYYPWAYCNIASRIQRKTYVEQLVEE
jgi:uncharacterized membrane protein YjgN (DUF898 family)